MYNSGRAPARMIIIEKSGIGDLTFMTSRKGKTVQSGGTEVGLTTKVHKDYFGGWTELFCNLILVVVLRL